MQKSVTKVDGIRERIKTEMETFEEKESEILQDNQKRQHYEKIRISEERKEREESLVQVNEKLDEIDKMVYEDTKE